MFARATHPHSEAVGQPSPRFSPQNSGNAFVAITGGAHLRRVVRLSTETGARFVRERISFDPAEWLATPKALFAGRSPLDACESQRGFTTAMLFHDLSLGLDCPASRLIGLSFPSDVRSGSSGSHRGAKAEAGQKPALYTFGVSADLGPGQVQIFGAMIATSAGEVRGRLRNRLGAFLEDEATVRLGFDWSEPLACAMVSDAMADVLMHASDHPESAIAAGLDFQVEQRFAS